MRRKLHVLGLSLIAFDCVSAAAGQDSVFQSFLSSADKAVEKGDLAAAERFLALAEREADGQDSKLGMVWVKQGFVADAVFRYAEAERRFTDGLTQSEKSKDKHLIAHRSTLLANHFVLCEKYEKAEPLYKRALAIREKVNGPNAWETAQLLRDIATLHRDAGRLEAAEPIYRRALQALEKSPGKDYHQAYCLASLGELLVRQEKSDEAEALCRQALETYKRQRAPAQYNRALCYSTLGESLRIQKKPAEAEAAFSSSLKFLDEGNIGNARALPVLKRAAKFYRENGRTAEATKLEEKANAIDEKHRKGNAASGDRQP